MNIEKNKLHFARVSLRFFSGANTASSPLNALSGSIQGTIVVAGFIKLSRSQAVNSIPSAAMPYPGPPDEFTKDRPLRLIVGPSDSGVCATSQSQPKLAVTGTVELHLAFAQEKHIGCVSLTFSNAVSTCVLVLFSARPLIVYGCIL